MYCFHREAHSELECSCACKLCEREKQKLILRKNHETVIDFLKYINKIERERAELEKQNFINEMLQDEEFQKQFQKDKNRLKNKLSRVKIIPIIRTNNNY